MLKGYIIFFCILALLNLEVVYARGSEGDRTNSILLNGIWEFVVGEGSEGLEDGLKQEKYSWTKVTLPGAFMKWSQEAVNKTRYVWARRNFTVSEEQARGLAVLRWNRIGSGAEAFINGKKVGENEPTGPYYVIVPEGILRAGENQIVLKVRGRAAVRRSKSGNELIPAGFGSGLPEVTDDVWIDFAAGAYMKWILAMPELEQSRVKIRVTPTGLKRLDNLIITARVFTYPDRRFVGEGRTSARVEPEKDFLGWEHFFVEVPMPGFKPWTPEEPNLYTAEVRLWQGRQILDEATIRFGMREIRVKDGNYKLNGKNLWLRGSNLVFEWDWGDTITGKEYDYLVTEAREMSMNAFRTHTRPPPRLWCDIGDENGTMFLAEFPVLYNYADYKFTPEEYEIYHRNVLRDSAGWMARLWNHPSVIMWVLSNESRVDNEWEEGVFQDFVNALDPTRPTMRTGTTGTRDNLDIHACGNVTYTEEGRLFVDLPHWFKGAGERTTTVSEYMNYFGHPYTQWSGVDDRVANAIAVAQIGAEHTEAMRRARFDAILPYMYAGWTRTRLAARVRETGKGSAVWKANFAAPESAVWHSVLSPVLASLDIFNADYFVGQEVETDLYLINDSWHDVQVNVDLLMTRECPEWIPEAACFDNPVCKWSYKFNIKADSIQKVPVKWRLPQEQGNYWLTARLTGIPGRAVLSQRFVRAIKPPVIPEAIKNKIFVVIGGDARAQRWFQERGVMFTEKLGELDPQKHTVVVWNGARLTAEEKQQAKRLCEFADRGGRIIVLSAAGWEWRELCEVKLTNKPRFSRVFPYDGARRRWFTEIDPQWLIRWNGLPGTVAAGTIEGAIVERGEKILWGREPKTVVMAEVPAAAGKGKVLFSQLDIQNHIDRSRPNYDPTAEWIFIKMLEGK